MKSADNDDDNANDTHPAWIIVRDAKYSVADKNDITSNVRWHKGNSSKEKTYLGRMRIQSHTPQVMIERLPDLANDDPIKTSDGDCHAACGKTTTNPKTAITIRV